MTDDVRYAEQLAAKRERLAALFAPLGAPAPEVHPSPPRHYRQRAEFRFWREGDDAFYAMFDRDAPKLPRRVDAFPPASARINAAMEPLRRLVRADPQLQARLFQVEFLSTLSGELLITLVYHRRLDDDWIVAARQLGTALDACLLGRSKGQCLVATRDFLTERLELPHRQIELRQPEGCFTQPNGEVNRAMLGWAHAAAGACSGGLLELYCGIGNFTLALADRFPRVLATEINKTAIAAAAHNLAANGIGNVDIARLSSAEAAAALARERPFRRLAHVDLDALDARTLLVDPPRAGLDPATLAFAARFDHLIYVSCNPVTLHANLEALQATHRIERLALFDQFPFTHHIESGVLLARR